MKGFATVLALCAIAPSAAFTASSRNGAKSSLNMADNKKISTFDTVTPYSTSTYNTNSDITTDKSSTSSTAYVRDLEQRLKNLERTQRTTNNNMQNRVPRQGPTGTFNGQQVLIQGDSLKTFSFASPLVDRVQVRLGTEGRPLSSDIELWQGPDNTPYKMRVYNEDGKVRPFNCVILTPRGPNTIAIRNTGQMEFPMAAAVSANTEFGDTESLMSFEAGTSMTIQGGALRTYPFDPSIESVQVLLKTDGRPLNARIELLQGPNNNKQVIEIYTEDGVVRPFFVVIETPGSGNVVRIVNTSPVEFPMTAAVEPYRITRYDPTGNSGVVIGGDSDRRW